jgi:hypothetical protein
MFLVESAAPAVMWKVAVIVVEFTTVTPVAVRPDPPKPLSVVPLVVKLLPVMVTGRLAVPRWPEVGLIEVTVATGGMLIVNGNALLPPPGLLTAMFLFPTRVPAPMLSVAVIVVLFTTVNPVTVIPVPPVTVNPVAPVKLVPVRVTATPLPLKPEFGAIEIRVGAGGLVTVNVTVLLVPPGVTTATFLAVSAAPAVMVKVAVTVVLFTTTRLLTVTPAPDTLMAEAPVRLVPVSVTGTAVPLTPELGAIEASVGAGMVTWDSIAPTSMADPGDGGRGLPKKSVGGATR